MSIPKEHIYSGVQTFPAGTTTHKNFNVHTQGRVTAAHEVVDVTLATSYGVDFATQQMLKDCKSVFWSGSRNHFMGLQEFFLSIPVELASRAGIQDGTYVYLLTAKVAEDEMHLQDTTQLFLLPSPGKAIGQFAPGIRTAILIGAVHTFRTQKMNFYPEVRDALWDVKIP